LAETRFRGGFAGAQLTGTRMVEVVLIVETSENDFDEKVNMSEDEFDESVR